MSLNQIVLHPHLLVDLYETSLIDDPAAYQTTQQLLPVLKDILIFSDSPTDPLSDEDQKLLTSILSACHVLPQEVSIFSSLIKKEDVSFVTSIKKSRIVLLFGTDPISIGMPSNFPMFQLELFDARTYLYAPSLSVLNKDKKLKTNLWMSLKTLFSV